MRFLAVNGQLSRIGSGIAFLIALIVRRRVVIICKHRQRGRLQCSPIKAKARDDFAVAYVGLKSVPCNDSNAMALPCG